MLRFEGKTYKEIAKELELTDYNMEHRAAIARLMAGERKGGGRRRRAP